MSQEAIEMSVLGFATCLVEGHGGSGRFIERFDGRAGAYSKNRPRYPAEVLRIMGGQTGFDRESVVADVGSGTGILSELFLENGNTVYGVEPNDEMRLTAERNLRKFVPRFVSVKGRAEATKLKDNSVDLVAVGQALHWFDLARARREFRRILKREGNVCIIYNLRREKGEVEEAYNKIAERYAANLAKVPDIDDALIARFLAGGFKKFVTPNFQALDLNGMLGRLASASYMPPPTSSDWVTLKEEVRKIIEKFGNKGVAVVHYDTKLYLGRISLN